MARADAPFSQIKPEDGCQPGGWHFAGEDLSAAAAPSILRSGRGPGEPYCVREPTWQTFAAFCGRTFGERVLCLAQEGSREESG